MAKFIKIIAAVLLLVLFSVQFTKLKTSYEQALLRALNEIPQDSFNDIVAATEEKKPLAPHKLDAYLRYTQVLARLDPERPDVFGLAGFCFFYKGDYDRAIESYAKAASLQPRFFGFHYNLAFIYFNQGRYKESLAEVHKAILCDPKTALLYILSSSQIYALMLVTKINVYGIYAEKQIKNGYEKAYLLMAAVEHHLNFGTPFPGEEQLSLEGY